MSGIWKHVKAVVIILWLISMVLSVIAVGGIAFDIFPQETTYTYEVKAQQVYDTGKVEKSDITEMDQLSPDEQRLLYDAFKKSDHFMGTSEVMLEYQEERLDTFTDWRTVESNGVLFVIAVNESTEKTMDVDAFKWYHWVPFYGLVYFAVLLFLAFLIPPNY